MQRAGALGLGLLKSLLPRVRSWTNTSSFHSAVRTQSTSLVWPDRHIAIMKIRKEAGSPKVTLEAKSSTIFLNSSLL